MVGQGRRGDPGCPWPTAVATEDIMVTPEILTWSAWRGSPWSRALEARRPVAVRALWPHPLGEAILGCPIHAQIQGHACPVIGSRVGRVGELSRSSQRRVVQPHDAPHRDDGGGQRWPLCHRPADDARPDGLAEAVLGPQMMCLSMYYLRPPACLPRGGNGRLIEVFTPSWRAFPRSTAVMPRLRRVGAGPWCARSDARRSCRPGSTSGSCPMMSASSLRGCRPHAPAPTSLHTIDVLPDDA